MEVLKTLGSVNVLSYNVKEALGDAPRAEGAVRLVEALDPGVAIFHSAYWTLSERDSPVLAATVRRLGDLGYDVTVEDEGDTTDRADKTGFVGFTQANLGSGALMGAGTRQGYLSTITPPGSDIEMLIGGLHATDTDEAARLVQVAALPEGLDALLTDANAMHRGARIARVLRLLRPFTDRLPEYRDRDRDFRSTGGLNARKEYMHLAQTLVWMANGDTLAKLERRLQMRDADPGHQSTVHLGPIGFGQLDHIHVAPHIAVSDFTVHKDGDLSRVSDHWPLSATLRPQNQTA